MQNHPLTHLRNWIQLAALTAALPCAAQADNVLRWTLKLPVREAGWSHVRDMQKDTAYRPTAAGDLVFVGCEHNGALLALDARTGAQRWRYYTDGPIRTQSAADSERVYTGSDDGFVHCLDHTGKLLWKAPAGKGARFVLGHGRLSSSWAVPTHPLLADGRLFVMGGCWPADGVYMNCFDATTGQRLWSSPSMQMRPMRVPHFILDGKVHVRTYSGTGGRAAAFDILTGAIHAWPKGFKTPPPERPKVPGSKDLLGSNTSGGLVFGSGRDGTLYCAGPRLAEAAPDRTAPDKHLPPAKTGGDITTAKKLVELAGGDSGHALVHGLTDGSLVQGLLEATNLKIVAIDPDPEKTDRIRRELDHRGAFDTHRLSMLNLSLHKDNLPPYFANLVLSESGNRPGDAALHSLRPYGGAELYKEDGTWKAKFRGPLEGAGDWTHEYANAAMNNSSGDTLVHGQLGILWYGGPASDVKYYLGGSRPMGALLVQGRMFLQGKGILAAFDAYNGRLLWEAPLPKIHFYSASHSGNARGLSKSTPWDDPDADAKADIPNTHRARATGLNMAAATDCIYVLAGTRCLRFDPATGKALPAWDMPLPPQDGETLCWGAPRIAGDRFVATAFRPLDMKHAKIGSGGNGGDWSGDRMPMSHLIAVDRQSGKLLWSQAAHHGFNNRALVATANRILCTDLLQTDAFLGYVENGRSLAGQPFSLRAFDLRTGKPAWSQPLQKLVKYITYDPRTDRLYVPNRYGRTWTDQGWGWPDLSKEQTRKKSGRPNGIFRAFDATTGKRLWEVSQRHYDGPFTVAGKKLLNRYGTAFDPETGHQATRISPLTGQPETYGLKKSGCAVLGACETMVAWRTAYHDLSTATSTQLPGFEAGCTTSLLPAGGLLNLPNYGLFHLRARAAALAMAPRTGGSEHWPAYQHTKLQQETPIQRIGFNFGAPGDRYDKAGTLWVRAFRGGDFKIGVEPAQSTYYRQVNREDWIAQSGVEGATKITLPTAINQRDKRAAAHFDIRLHFAPNSSLHAGSPPSQDQPRIFDIRLEGEPAIEDFDLAKAGGNPAVVTVENLRVTGPLDIELTAKAGKTLLCGVELVRRN